MAEKNSYAEVLRNNINSNFESLKEDFNCYDIPSFLIFTPPRLLISQKLLSPDYSHICYNVDGREEQLCGSTS